MAIQFSTVVRNAMLDAIESGAGAGQTTGIGVSAILKIRTTSPPATCATADSGSVLATINLASDWASNASAGAKSLSGLPVTDASADATGTAAHFRLYASDGTTCHMQGTVGTSASDLIVDSTSFTAGQTFNVTAFTLTAPGA